MSDDDFYKWLNDSFDDPKILATHLYYDGIIENNNRSKVLLQKTQETELDINTCLKAAEMFINQKGELCQEK